MTMETTTRDPAYAAQCNDIGARGVAKVIAALNAQNFKVVPFMDPQSQAKKGDFYVAGRNVEVKTEQRFTGNVAIEIAGPGWLYLLTECNDLIYVFLDRNIAYRLKFPELLKFMAAHKDEYQTKEPRGNTRQSNQTQFKAIPIKKLTDEGVASQWTNFRAQSS